MTVFTHSTLKGSRSKAYFQLTLPTIHYSSYEITKPTRQFEEAENALMFNWEGNQVGKVVLVL